MKKKAKLNALLHALVRKAMTGWGPKKYCIGLFGKDAEGNSEHARADTCVCWCALGRLQWAGATTIEQEIICTDYHNRWHSDIDTDNDALGLAVVKRRLLNTYVGDQSNA